MDSGTVALMILLACAPDFSRCDPLGRPHLFETLVSCQSALPDAINDLSATLSPVIGRCEGKSSRFNVDPIMTGAAIGTPSAVSKRSSLPDTAVISVVRGNHGSRQFYRVPVAEERARQILED